MARTWTRLHEHLGRSPGKIVYEMVEQAVGNLLEESDDLDWKEELPAFIPVRGKWNEFAKDVAAMANTRGGLLIYGVSDSIELVGVDLSTVNEKQMLDTLRNGIQPYISEVDIIPLPNPAGGGPDVLVVDVAPSRTAPHFQYGWEQKDKDRVTFNAPYRVGRDTVWMPEHLVARAYRDRFARQAAADSELQQHLAYASEVCLGADPKAAWLVVASRLQQPLPPTLPRLTPEEVRNTLQRAAGISSGWRRLPTRSMPSFLDGLDGVTPRVGLRRWVVSNMLTTADRRNRRPMLVELHDDGTLVYATNLSWDALQRIRGEVHVQLPVHIPATAAAARDAVALAAAFRQALRDDSAADVTATVRSDRPDPYTAIAPDDFSETIPEYARRPPRFLPASLTLPRADNPGDLCSMAEELAGGVIHQFGIEHWI
ncbi:AlbA family DNA-binding domain-containing protein [Streptomyces aidingensis]|nr:ATP-binding protein [Streptomyces aidingensis]